ncbi:hypothetical protein VM1G_04722 [Cytospora mali]|uniref:Uncharacterized protein n=1 Tax=Cytospora mali TaxID=578113 RepID=A0A194VZB4_CYTMA|nr:hypothetical protein VM1G_04722 [Valsa mali]
MNTINMAQHISTLTIALITFISALVNASCKLGNQLTESNPPPEPKSELCVTQDEGSWTFAMDVHEIDVPTFDASAPWAGLVHGNSFMIYDNNCIVKGVYSPGDEGNNCGTPYVIEENFLRYVLTIKDIDFDVGSPSFKFAYADGTYSIGENNCDCKDVSDDLEAEQACKCAFPLDGA